MQWIIFKEDKVFSTLIVFITTRPKVILRSVLWIVKLKWEKEWDHSFYRLFDGNCRRPIICQLSVIFVCTTRHRVCCAILDWNVPLKFCSVNVTFIHGNKVFYLERSSIIYVGNIYFSKATSTESKSKYEGICCQPPAWQQYRLHSEPVWTCLGMWTCTGDGALFGDLPPPNRQTDTIENITFPQFRWPAVIIVKLFSYCRYLHTFSTTWPMFGQQCQILLRCCLETVLGFYIWRMWRKW